MAYYTQGEIDVMINKAQQALAYNTLECLTAREIGRDTKPFYLKGRFLSGAIKIFSAIDGINHHRYTDAQIESIMNCLNKNGVNKFNYSVIGAVIQKYSAAITQGTAGVQGIQGNDGIRGSIWTYGVGAPSLSGGEVDGDIYLNTSNGDIYRYEAGTWGSVADNIYGIQGVRGYTYPGTSTDTYTIGATDTLTCRPNLNAGDADALAYAANDRVLLTDVDKVDTFMVVVIDSYDQATGFMVFDTSKVEYLVLVGVPQALPATGLSGSNWTLNITGRVGPIGIQGIQGVGGARGSIWTVGTGVPTHVGTEVDGDMYLNTTNGDVYRNNSATWGSVVDNITGPQGLQGIQGPAGAGATLSSELAEHDTTGSVYALTGSTVKVSTLGLTTAGTDGRRHIHATMLFRNKAVSTEADFGIYVAGTLVNTTTDTTFYSCKWIQVNFDDYETKVVAISTIVSSVGFGDVIEVRGIKNSGDADLIAGNLRVFKEN